MAHQPETPEEFVCANCQLTHAGTPVHVSGGEHTYDPPSECGGCGESTFIKTDEWARHHG